MFWKIWKVHLLHCTIVPLTNVELALVASCIRLDSHFLLNQNKIFNLRLRYLVACHQGQIKRCLEIVYTGPLKISVY